MNKSDNRLNWRIGDDEKNKVNDLIGTIVEDNIIAFTDAFMDDAILVFSLGEYDEENNSPCFRLLGNEKPDGTLWAMNFDARKLFIDFAYDEGMLEETVDYLEAIAKELREIHSNVKNRSQ